MINIQNHSYYKKNNKNSYNLFYVRKIYNCNKYIYITINIQNNDYIDIYDKLSLKLICTKKIKLNCNNL
jgi:hypothetical protein